MLVFFVLRTSEVGMFWDCVLFVASLWSVALGAFPNLFPFKFSLL